MSLVAWQALVAGSGKNTLQMWHECLGIGVERLKQLRDGMANGVKFFDDDLENFDCEVCILGKAHKAPIYNKSVERAEAPGNKLHWDTCGPMKTPSVEGNKYLVVEVDDATRYTFSSFVKSKDEVADCVKQTVAYVECNKGVNTVKEVHSDGGSEYTSKELNTHLKSLGITPTFSAPYTPQHNGVAERKIQSIVNAARCMLIESGLPMRFWSEAMRYATIIENRAPTKAVDGVTPYEAWHNKKPDLASLRIFGCRVLALDHEGPAKLDVKTREMLYMGPAMGGDGHRLFNPATGKYLASRDVHFIENSVKVSNEHISDSLPPYASTDTLSEEPDGSDSDFFPDDSSSDGEED